MAALVVLRNKAIKPLLAAARELRPSRGAQNSSMLDSHYDTIAPPCEACFRNSGWSREHRQLFCSASPLSA